MGEDGRPRPAHLCCWGRGSWATLGRTRGHIYSNGKYLSFDPTTQAQGSLLQKCPIDTEQGHCIATLLAQDRVPPFPAGQTLPMGLLLSWASPRRTPLPQPFPHPFGPTTPQKLWPLSPKPMASGVSTARAPTQTSSLEEDLMARAWEGLIPSPCHQGPLAALLTSQTYLAHWAPAPAHALHSTARNLSQAWGRLAPSLAE